MSPCPQGSCPSSGQGPGGREPGAASSPPPLFNTGSAVAFPAKLCLPPASTARPQGQPIRTARQREQKPTGNTRSSESHPSHSASEGNQVPHSATPKKTKYYMFKKENPSQTIGTISESILLGSGSPRTVEKLRLH